MTHPSDAYFNQTQTGESRWWSWIMVFWFMILGWIIAQMVFISPIGVIAQEVAPERHQALNDASAALFENEGTLKAFALYGAIFMLTTLLAIVFWIINRVTTDTARRVFGWLTGFCVAGSFYGLIRLAPLSTDADSTAILSELMGASPLIYMLFLLVFPATCAGLYIAYVFIHKRSLVSLHSAAAKINWARGLQAFIISWIVLGVLSAIGHVSGISPLSFNFQPKIILAYALVSLLVIPLQSGTEEIIFRGYLNQALYHFIKNKWVVFIITSLLFSAMHLSNPEALDGAENGMLLLTMSGYFVFGFVCCILVWMDGGLESAIGLHAANNTFAAIFINYEGSVLPTPSLFLAQTNSNIDIPVTIITLSLIAYILYYLRPNKV